MNAIHQLAQEVGTARACDAVGIARASFYRRKSRALHQADLAHAAPRPTPPRALTDEERQQVLATLHSERFVDKVPVEVYAALLDEGRYLCSVRTMYRILDEAHEVRERRDQLRHPQYKKPELLATAPNQVWSWDITKLLGPAKWTYYYLYVILDIFSRYAIGWMVAAVESAQLATRLIRETVHKEGVDPDQLTIHSDRGPSMKSQLVAQLMADLGITKSHSRPHVSDDNPYSESQFKTIKYRPEFPDRFGCQEHARSLCGKLFHWYNWEHYHSGIALLTPGMVHYGLALQVLAQREQVLLAAYAAHPERFVTGPPSHHPLPQQVWINPPVQRAEDHQATPGNDTLIETGTCSDQVTQPLGLSASLLTSAQAPGRLMVPTENQHSLKSETTQTTTTKQEETRNFPAHRGEGEAYALH